MMRPSWRTSIGLVKPDRLVARGELLDLSLRVLARVAIRRSQAIDVPLLDLVGHPQPYFCTTGHNEA
jgi:hypothetical protein